MKVKRYLAPLLFFILLCTSTFSMAASADDAITVRVGLYDNQPKIFTDGEGNALGLWPDIIEYIAAEEGWEIEYVYGTWAQCLERLGNNEIDIMPDVAYTDEREELYAFSDETVYTSWSRVYTREWSDIQSILDLEGKTIAVLTNSVNVEGSDGIKELVEEFGVNCTFLEADNYMRVFELVESGEADAGVANKDFYYQNRADFDIGRTAIIFQPASLRFAFPKDSSLTPYLMEKIDYHVKVMKEDGDSVYYQSLGNWLGVTTIEKTVIPDWIKWALIGIGGLALLLAGGTLILRSQVRSRTKELTEEIAERKKMELSVLKNNRALRVLSQCNQVLIRSADEPELLNEVCRVLVEDGGYPLAWVSIAESDKEKTVHPIAQRGDEDGYLDNINITWADTERGHGPTGTAIRTGKPSIIRNTLTDPTFAPWREEAAKRGYASLIALPLISNTNKTFGSLNIYSTETDAFNQDEIDLLMEMANDLSYGITSLRNRTDRELAEEQLRKSEARYSTLVEKGNDGIIIIQDGLLKFANTKMLIISGYTTKEVIDKPFLDFCAPEYRELVINRYKRRIAGEEVANNYEVEILSKTGEQTPVEINASVIEYDGKPADMAIIRDVTERKQAQAALIKSEEKCHAIFEAATDGILLADIETKKLYEGNHAICQMTGYTLEELKNLGIKDIHPGERLSSIIGQFDNQAKGAYSLILDVPIKRKDGSIFYADINSAPVSFGARTYLMGMFRDATERRQIEGELRKLFQAVEQSPVIVMITDPEGNVEYVNPKFEDITGYTRHEMLGTSAGALGQPSQQETEQMWANLGSGQEWHGEFYNRKKNGEYYWESALISPVKDQHGKVTNLIKVAEDITERKAMLEALQESEEKLRLIFESAAEAITVTDLEGKFIQLNEAAVKLYGYSSKKELIGLNSLELFGKTDCDEAIKNLKETLNTGSGGTKEFTLMRKDGSQYIGEVSTALMRDTSGNPSGIVTITKDVTERRQMQERLMITDRLASVGELASGIAHELNNPLTSVIGLSELLLKKDMSDEINEDLKLVYSEAQRAAQVVKNLLTFARKHPPLKQQVNINEVINKVLELRAYEEKVSNIEVITNLAPNLPEITADYFQLQQVFLNIVINAEYFMTEAHNRGTLTITTEIAGNMIRASFADDGPGIPKENLGHLFDPFFTTKEVGKGTGLGLSICHGIITAQNGNIYAESKPGKGATFVVELPVNTNADYKSQS